MLEDPSLCPVQTLKVCLAKTEVLSLANARSYEVCTLMASLAFRGSVDMEDIQ